MDQQFQPTPQFEPAPPPPPMPAPASDKKGLAIAALVLGILSLCSSWFFCGGLLGVIGVILGLLGMKSSGRTMAIIGIVLSVVGLIFNDHLHHRLHRFWPKHWEYFQPNAVPINAGRLITRFPAKVFL